MPRSRPFLHAAVALLFLPGPIPAQPHGAARTPPRLHVGPTTARIAGHPLADDTVDPLDRFTGRYVLDSAASEPVPEAIERTVAPMNMIVRSVARRRLARLNQPKPRLEIAVTSAAVDFRYPGEPVVRLTRANTATEWRNAEGEEMRVQLLASDPSGEPALREQYDTKDGRRINEYRLDANAARLRVRVTVTGPRLSIPLTYALAYRRE